MLIKIAYHICKKTTNGYKPGIKFLKVFIVHLRYLKSLTYKKTKTKTKQIKTKPSKTFTNFDQIKPSNTYFVEVCYFLK